MTLFSKKMAFLWPGFDVVTSVRIDGRADHVNKKPDLIIEKRKIRKYHSCNLTRDSSDGCNTQ